MDFSDRGSLCFVLAVRRLLIDDFSIDLATWNSIFFLAEGLFGISFCVSDEDTFIWSVYCALGDYNTFNIFAGEYSL